MFGLENNPSKIRNPSYSSDDNSDGLINFISFLIPLAGVIIYAVNINEKPNMANAAGMSAIMGIFFGIICGIIYYYWLMSQINSYY